jgi:hypothetical protein
LQFFGMAAGFGYMEAMVFGTLLFLAAIFYPDLRTMPWPAALACGLLSGLGIWAEPIFGEYLAAVVLAFGARLLFGDATEARGDRRGLARNVAAIALGGLVGSAPLLAYNLQHRWETLAFLHARGLGGDHLAVLERVVTESFPILLGLITPTISGPAFAHQLSVHPVRHLAGILIGGIVVGRLALDPRCLPRRIAALGLPLAPARRRAPTEHAAGRDGVLALLAVSCLACFAFTRFGAEPWATRLPRYLLPLYTIAPLVLDRFIPRSSRPLRHLAPPIVVGLLLAAGLTITVAEAPPPADPTAVAGVAFTAADIGGLDAMLERDGVRVVYTSYWLANRISFETRERIVGVSVRAAFQLAQNRLPSYLTVAARTPPAGLSWIFQAGSHDDLAFRALLRRAAAAAIRTSWGSLAVYTGFTRPLRAPLATP